MSISGINSNYNSYYNNTVSRNQKASETSESSATSPQKTSDDMLAYYKNKYTSLNFTAGYNTKGAGGAGLGNVILHPNLLKKMAADPEFAAKAENNIKYIPQAEAWKKSMCAANGMNLVSSGCFVDENGNIAGSWSYVETSTGGKDDKQEWLDKLREKQLSEKAMMDKIMASRFEHSKQPDGISQPTQTSTNTNAYLSALTNVAAAAANKDKLT